MLTSFVVGLFKCVLWLVILIAVGIMISSLRVFNPVVLGLLLLILLK